jgi:hypothetical protein
MGSGVISPGEDTSLRNIRGEKILEPIDVILCCPAFLAFSIKAMNRDDAMMRQQSAMAATLQRAHSKVGLTPSTNFFSP